MQLVRSGVSFKYEARSFRLKMPLTRPRTAECNNCGGSDLHFWISYTPDWFLSNGIIIESKGKFDKRARDIQAAMKEQYPDVDIRMLFQRNNCINKGSKTRYTQWCDKKEIPCAVKTIPKTWLSS